MARLICQKAETHYNSFMHRTQYFREKIHKKTRIFSVSYTLLETMYLGRPFVSS